MRGITQKLIDQVRNNSLLETPVELAANPMSDNDDLDREQLISALAENNSITHLKLDMDFSNPQQVIQLAEVLKKNQSLKVLYLLDCKIDTSGLLLLAQALEINPTLKLKIQGHKASPALAAGLFASFNTSERRVSYSETTQATVQHPKAKEATDYLLSQLLPVLRNEKAKLEAVHGNSEPSVLALDALIHSSLKTLNEFTNNQIPTVVDLKSRLESEIQNELSNPNLNSSWAQTMGTLLLNILILLPVVTLVAKRAITGTWFFSNENPTATALHEAVDQVRQMDCGA